MDSVIIVTQDGPLAALVQAARSLGGAVTAAVVGPRELAEQVAACGPDQVQWYSLGQGVPPEAAVGQVADAASRAAARVVLALADPAARVLLAGVAARLGAALVTSASGLAVEGDTIVVTRSAVEDKVLQTLEVSGPLAVTFEGEDADTAPGSPAPISEVPVAPIPALQVLGQSATEVEAGLAHAARVVGVGRGLARRDDLAMIDDLAAALGGAEIACTLPLADDMRWFDQSHVVGTSTSQIAPDLYLAVGLSGQPQHMSGVRRARVVVAINNDPQAAIFKHCDYGIVADLYQVVPILTRALTS